MPKQTITKKIKIIITTIFVLFAIVALNSSTLISSAAEVSSETERSCQPQIKEFLDKETKEFEKFIVTHLKSEKSTSELMKKANQRYLKYRAALLNKRSTLALITNIPNRDLATQDIEMCQSIIDKYLKTAAAYQKRMIIANSTRKNTIRMAERIRDINNKLNTLNRNVGSIRGFLQAFSQKVPCYVGNCPPL